MADPLTPTARRVLAPSYYNEYSKLVGDALSLQKSELDRQRNMFELERARTEAAREEASRAALPGIAAEISALDPNDPDTPRRRMEILARNPDALYNRATAQFLGVSEEAMAEPRYMRQMQKQQEIYDRREQEQEAARQKRADDAFARQIALKSGRRDFYENWRSKYEAAKTDDERRKVTDDLGWEDRQWSVEQELIDEGIDPETLREPTPDGKGTYLGKKAETALRVKKQQKSQLQQQLEAEGTLGRLRRERAQAMDPTNPDANAEQAAEIETRIKRLEQLLGSSSGGAIQGPAGRYLGQGGSTPTQTPQGKAASKFP